MNMDTSKVIVCIMAIMCMAGIAGAIGSVPYSKDVYGTNAPFISMIDPIGDAVEVTTPGGLVDSRMIFVDVFGNHKIEYAGINMDKGEVRTFTVPLKDNKGHVGIYTDYYVAPEPTLDYYGIPNPGAINNPALSAWSNVAYLNATKQPGKIYKLGTNGIWGWVPGNNSISAPN